MSKTDLCYSTTIIYKIFCNDKNIKDEYIGYTTNFTHRKHYHKHNCKIDANIKHNNLLYDTIQKQGGWNNWKMEKIATFNLPNQYTAKQKEQEYINIYKPSLNNTPFVKENIQQDISFDEIVDDILILDDNTKKNKSISNYNYKYNCKPCNYFTHVKCNYDKHLLTEKHTREIICQQAVTEKYKVASLSCEKCNKKYTNRTGLWRHNKTCKQSELVPTNINTEPTFTPTPTTVCNDPTPTMDQTAHLTNLVMKVLEQNQELTKQIIELSKQTSVTNNTINNNNNNFSINVFLNETCKDALNITDFVDSLVLSINDLEETGRLGYANGISKIFINGLKNLDIDKRPLHCSDIKRNTLYIKDDNQWIKETNETPLLTKAIKNVSNKNIQTIFEWQKLNPHYNDSDSKQNDKYNKIICEAMSGSCKEEQLKNYEKIVNKIAKEVVIEK